MKNAKFILITQFGRSNRGTTSECPTPNPSLKPPQMVAKKTGCNQLPTSLLVLAQKGWTTTRQKSKLPGLATAVQLQPVLVQSGCRSLCGCTTGPWNTSSSGLEQCEEQMAADGSRSDAE